MLLRLLRPIQHLFQPAAASVRDAAPPRPKASAGRGPAFAAALLAAELAGLSVVGPVRAADASGPALDAAAQAQLAGWQARARALQLAENPAWLDLLHVKTHPLTGRRRSLADDGRFFNAPQGATDPAAELDATLAAFFDPRPLHPGEQAAACRFPARLAWLGGQLGFDRSALPAVDCSRYEQWLAGMQAQSVSLIFPSAYVNSPASMYGHTFLRINQGPAGRNNPMLAYTISYAADGNEAEGLAFAFKGLTGLYAGRFTTTPYYRRIEEYTHLENRDIWEYDLALTPAEIAQLLAHTWELGYTRFDYYFFDENCSYHLLSLLDVARPGLHLTDAFTWWALPVDTVRVLFREPGLVGAVQYRPSNSTELGRLAAGLADAQLDEVKQLVDGRRPAGDVLAAEPPEQRALALEVAERLVSYRGAVEGLGEQQVQGLRRNVLAERARLPPLPKQAAPRPSPPEAGHATARLDLGLADHEGETRWRLGLRPAYHDLLDPERGFQPGAQIQFGALELSGGAGTPPRLERLLPVDIVSLTPYDRLLGRSSWKVQFGLQRAFGRMPGRDPLQLFVNGGPGASWRLPGSSGFAYALLDNQASWTRHPDRIELADRLAIGSGLQLGVIADPAPGWRVQVDARARAYLDGVPRETGLSARLRVALDADWNLLGSCENRRRGDAPAQTICLAELQRYW